MSKPVMDKIKELLESDMEYDEIVEKMGLDAEHLLRMFHSSMKEEKEKQKVSISECERGNTWLVSEEGNHHYALFEIKNGVFLEIDIVQENYPGFNVKTVNVTKEELLQHIQENCSGMFVRKCNLGDLQIDSQGCVEEKE